MYDTNLVHLSFTPMLRSKFYNTENSAVVPALVLELAGCDELMSRIRPMISSLSLMMDHASNTQSPAGTWVFRPRHRNSLILFAVNGSVLWERGRLVRHVHVGPPVTLIHSRGPFHYASIPVRRRLYGFRLAVGLCQRSSVGQSVLQIFLNRQHFFWNPM